MARVGDLRRKLGDGTRSVRRVRPHNVRLQFREVEHDQILPLEDGDYYHFYFSGESGSWLTEGPILWRAVNGVPDVEWSMRTTKGTVDLGEFEAVFEYFPPANPDLVRLTVATTVKSGSKEVTRELHTEFLMRNHKYQ